MACYVSEEEAWKCPKHPSKSRQNGVCPTCLRNRLGSLCPVCANVRPCGCVSNTTSSTSSSSSSSISFFNNASDISRASNFSEAEPSFRRSRSVAIPFIRSSSRRISTPSFLRKIATKESYEFDHLGNDDEISIDSSNRIKEFARVVTRSRSVSTGTSKAVIAPGVQSTSSPAKWKLWHFPSPLMKVFRSSKTSKVMVQDRSPMHSGKIMNEKQVLVH